MANIYVRSGAGGAATGVDWANAFTTLALAMAGTAAGDNVWVSEDHAETAAAPTTITFPGSVTNPNFCYCVDHAGSVPPVAADLRTTATVTRTAANAVTIGGSAYVYGITFTAGSGASGPSLTVSNGNVAFMRFDNCAFRLGGTTGGNIVVSRSNNKTWWKNCTVQVANTGSFIQSQGQHIWEDTASAITGATLPTNLFSGAFSNGFTILRGVDLSALGAGKTLVLAGNTSLVYQFIDCKLAASVTIAGTPTNQAGHIDLIRGDSGATNYRDERYWMQGTQTVETTIVRAGGATDGTTPIAWKLVTTADSKWIVPFEAQPIVIWNDTTGSPITVTMYGIWGGGAVPNSDDIWLDAEYLGDASTPKGSFINSTKASNLAAGVALTSDSSTWGGSTTAFKMSVTFTPQMKGPINLAVKAAKASTTFYIDPRPDVTGVPVRRSYPVAPGLLVNEPATVQPIYALGV